MCGIDDCVYLGNLDAKRDWGHARDYVRGMWMILQHPQPDDFVLATGKARTVREFVEASCRCVDIDIRWRGHGVEEQGYDSKTGKVLVRIDPTYYRPTEVDALLGDYSKAKKKLGWEPSIPFETMVQDMMRWDMALAERERSNPGVPMSLDADLLHA
jgi:GDPmannose 4,6-dehydratase